MGTRQQWAGTLVLVTALLAISVLPGHTDRGGHGYKGLNFRGYEAKGHGHKGHGHRRWHWSGEVRVFISPSLVVPVSLQVRQPRPVYTQCAECTAEMTPSTIPACATCRRETYHLCACGCGRYRRKYDAEGHLRLYISGHNDVWANRQRPLRECTVCRKPFPPNTRRQRLCSIPCRTVWLTMNPPHESKRVLVECAVCGTQIARRLSQVQSGQDAACSPRCRYILVANKLRGRNISGPKRLALRRDGARCRICGFDTLVEVHHIIPRRHNGPDTLDNLITLCPNHHTMADRGLISVEDLCTRIAEPPPTGLASMTA